MTNCALVYDSALRAALTAEGSARAPDDDARDAIERTAIARLAALSPDAAIRMVDGRSYRAARPVEVAAASEEASEAVGYLALLRAAVEEIEALADRRSALQFLIAPARSEASFGAALDRAEAAKRACLDRRRRASGLRSPATLTFPGPETEAIRWTGSPRETRDPASDSTRAVRMH